MTAPSVLIGSDDELESPPRQSEQEVQPEAPTYGDEPEAGELLSLPEPEAAKRLLQIFIDQHDLYRRPLLEWEVNRRRRQGEVNVWVAKTRDQASYQIWVAPGAGYGPGVAVLNKSDRLCTRLASYLYTDPAEPDVEPKTGSDEDRDSADLYRRVIEDEQSEAKLNDFATQRREFDISASCTGSAFLRYYIDPTRGGRQPIEVMASPQADTVENALQNPETGVPWGDELLYRYVRADGALTDTAAEAATRWVPGLARDCVPAEGVRFCPPRSDVWEANGVITCQYLSWREVVRRHPDLAGNTTVRDAAVKYRPAEMKHVLPWLNGKRSEPKVKEADDRLVLYTCGYFVTCSEYPEGAYLHLVGEHLIERGPWILVRSGVKERLDLPITQLKQFDDDLTPMGRGLMHVFGPSSEFRAHLVGVVSDLLDWHINRKVYVPVHSTFNPKSATLALQRYIPINPQGEPKTEDVPEIPDSVPFLWNLTNSEMDDASTLQQSAQGVETPDAQSGRAKLAVISQVHAGLSGMRDNAVRAYERSCRIIGQLVSKYYTVPQIMEWVGEDGQYKVKRWLGTDLGSVRDVRIKQGTFTMMSHMQKMEAAQSFIAAGLALPEELQDVVRSGLKAQVGLQDDPHLERVRRQVSRWEQGPQTQPPPLPPQPVPDPMTGQLMPPPNPYAEELVRIFDDRPCDSIPAIALMRLREFGRAMARAKYEKFDPAWRAGLMQAFEQARFAAMPPPPQGAPPPDQKETPADQKPELTPAEQAQAGGAPVGAA